MSVKVLRKEGEVDVSVVLYGRPQCDAAGAMGFLSVNRTRTAHLPRFGGATCLCSAARPSSPRRGRVAPWRERLFAAMARNARGPPGDFNVPSGRLIELGTKIEI